jgi:RimJ/RimL family protein N-acetyltransferase
MQPPSWQRAQALVAQGRMDEALAELESGWLTPGPWPPRLQMVRELLTQWLLRGQADRARPVLADLMGRWPRDKPWPNWLARLQWACQPDWWTPLRSGGMGLRRPRPDDAAWLQAAFAMPAFARAVNRDYARQIAALPQDRLAAQLASQQGRSPVDLGAWMLVIEGEGGDRLGVSAVVAIDADSRRGEFIMGFTDPAQAQMKAMACAGLMTWQCFTRLGFHKVACALYSDNPRLQELKRMLGAMGFQHEGVQREHLRAPSGAYIDVHHLGALQRELMQSRRLVRLLQRYTDATPGTNGDNLDH